TSTKTRMTLSPRSSEYPKVTSARESTGSNRDFSEAGPNTQVRSILMEFDELKRVWKECDRRLGTGIKLNTDLLRALIAADPTGTARGPLWRALEEMVEKIHEAISRVRGRHRVFRG